MHATYLAGEITVVAAATTAAAATATAEAATATAAAIAAHQQKQLRRRGNGAFTVAQGGTGPPPTMRM